MSTVDSRTSLKAGVNDLPVLDLPADRPRSTVSDAGSRVHVHRLGAGLRAGLEGLAKVCNAALPAVHRGAFGALLQRLSGQSDILFGVSASQLDSRTLFPVALDFSTDPALVDVLEQIAVTERPAAAPVYTAMLVESPADLESENVMLEDPGCELLAELRDVDGGIEVAFHYRAELFDHSTIVRWAAAYERLLRGVVDEPRARLSRLPVGPGMERHRTLLEWNDTKALYPRKPLSHELFLEQAKRNPGALAVQDGGELLTYGELAEQAASLSRELRRLGVGPEVRVGLFIPSCPEMFVGLLGVMMAGGAYVPIDPDYPAERITFILEDAGISVLLTSSRLKHRLPAFEGPVLELDTIGEALVAESGGALPDVELTANHLAYAIYTSGSTGRPKGVGVSHGALLNLVHWHQEGPYQVGPADRWIQLSSPSFDGSVWEIWPTLAAGGSLHVPPSHIRSSAPELLRFLADQEITLAFIPTSLTEAMLAEEWPEEMAMRIVMTGGEALRKRPVPGLPFRLVNNYGPTETTAIVCCEPVSTVDDGTLPPIGRPLGNVGLYVVDRGFQAVPAGVPGELVIAGAGLGRGYLGRPALTASRFVPDPFSDKPGRRLYRTSDRTRWRGDGNIEFLGRLDRQVKLRGFRIELGEVEAALMRQPNVREAAVILREDTPGFKRLVAYLATDREGLVEELTFALTEKLPSFMIPGFYVVLPELPKNAHGKVDRRALPEPPSGEYSDSYVVPRTPLERRLAEIWSELLGVEPVGAEDDFFMLGGNSLLATRMLSRVHQDLGVSVPFGQFLPAPALVDLAEEVAAAGGFVEPEEAGHAEDVPEAAAARIAALNAPIPRQPMRRSYPLSAAQRGVWLSLELDPDNPSYNLHQVLELRGPLSRDRLRDALQSWADRWDVVRTTVALQEEEPVQRFGFLTVELPFEDLASRPESSRSEELERRLDEIRRAPYDLEAGPLCRFHLFRLSEQVHVLTLGLHHLVADGVSLEVIANEVLALYEGRSLPLPKVQYQDFIAWQKEHLESGTFEDSRRYWLDRLAGDLPELELPLDRPRPARPSYEGTVWTMPVAKGLEDRLQAMAREHSTTLFCVVFAAFKTYLRWLTRTDDLIVGAPFSGRTHPDLADQVGFFVTSPALRTDLAGDLSFAEALARFDATVSGALEHEVYPFDALLEELDVERDPSRSPVYTVLFNIRPPVLEETSGELSVQRWTRLPHVAQYELQVVILESEEGLELAFIYRTQLFDASTIARWGTGFEHLLGELAARPEAPFSRLAGLRPSERHMLLVESNDTAAAYPRDRRLHELIEEQVEKTPDAVALSFGDLHLSYRALDRWAARVASELVEGLAPEAPVGVCLERSLEMVVALVAVLKAGGAYLPLDPEYPRQRIARMLEDAAAPAVLTVEALRSRLPDHGARTLCLEAGPVVVDAVDAPAVPRPSADRLAYVIYTSGSTGRPKGAMNSHRAIVNRLLWMQDEYGLDGSDRIVQKTPFSFDVSVWEFFWPLMTGARLVIARPGGHRDADYLVDLVARERITTMHFVPSMLQIFADHEGFGELDSLRRVIASGEALPADLERRFFERSRAGLHNLYGPTEAAVDVTYWACDRARPRPSVPLGRPIANLRIHVLDPSLEVAPSGAAGELHIAGDGLGRGYLGRPALTAETFLPDPLSTRPGRRLYRSGDLARRSADGLLEFLGRLDHQVKVRGLRIELGEIETVLAEHPGVREVAVVARSAGSEASSGPLLVAYVVSSGAKLSSRDLATHLSARVPIYMVPSAFVFLESLPLNANGKLDRRALPVPGQAAYRGAESFVPPRSPIEEILARIWSEILGVERVGIRERFFALGGHSLLAIRVMWRVRTMLGVELPVTVLFESPTIEVLAARIQTALEEEGGTAPSQPIERLEAERRSEALPLSFAQQRLWFLHQLEPSSAAYNFPLALELEGDLLPAALEGALQEIVRRHDVLRARFSVREGRPVQQAAPAALPAMARIDLADLPAAARGGAARRLLDAEARRPFDLGRAALRIRLLRLEPRRHVLFVCLHHVVADGWSIDVLRRELVALYEAFSGPEASPPLAELPVQYADYAWWERQRFSRGELTSQLEYWREQLDEIPVLELPTDRPRPLALSYRAGFHALELSGETVRGLRATASDAGATFYMGVLAALQALLHRLTGQRDVAVGSPTANRSRSEVDGLIGCFVNTLVLRGDLGGRPGFRELLSRVREVALEAYAHQEVPFDKLVEELQPERDLARNPFFQVVLAPQATPPATTRLDDDLEMRPEEIFPPWVRFDLECHLWEHGDDLRFRFCYSTDLFDAATIERFASHFETLLHEVVAEPARPVDEIALMSPAEREQLLRAWEAAAPAGTEPRCVHELFEEQARRAPDALAVISDAVAAGTPGSLSYGELDRRADRLARFLRSAGVTPEAPVGIAMERCLEMMIAILGVLKAGGAYLPLDPVNPPSRLRAMMEDATSGREPAEGEAILLTLEALAGELAGPGWQVVCLDGGWPGMVAEVGEAALPEAALDRLAYIIYTSGSTGRPKGVQAHHRGLLNLVSWHRQAYEVVPEDRATVLAAPGFDASVWEIWPYLASGATLLIPPPEMVPAPRELARWIEERRLTLSFLPTPVAETFLAETAGLALAPAGLRAILTGGDRLHRRPADDRTCRLLNHYGPTESTVVSTWAEVLPEGGDGRLPAIGGPIAGLSVRLLDTRLELVPPGVTGELCVGGAGLVRGYLGQPALTAEKFVPDPFGDMPGARLYRTGDLARGLPSGEIDFLRRADQQVKVRGFRIELAEIEAFLTRIDGVQEAVVVLGEGPSGEARLWAYAVPADFEAVESSIRRWSRRLRDQLQQHLPSHMIPSAFVPLREVPLTANGKVDREALPSPDTEAAEAADVVPPSSLIESHLSDVFKAVLGLETVGVDQNFFELGASSLMLVEVRERLERVLGREIQIVDLFRYPNVRALAEYLDPQEASAPAESPRKSKPVRFLGTSEADGEGWPPIAIIGLAGNFPGAPTVRKFWQNLCDGVESIDFLTLEEFKAEGGRPEIYNEPNFVPASGRLEDPGLFDAAFFGFAPRDAEALDPQHRLFLETAWEVLEAAGYDPQRSGDEIGVFAGCSMNNYVHGFFSQRRSMGVTFNVGLANTPDSLATRVSYKFDLRGPAVNFQNACSTSLVAAHHACLSLLAGECRMAVVGASSIRGAHSGYHYEPGGIFSQDGHCRAFDEKADGTIDGIGSGAVVLKLLSQALEDGDHVHAVIRGSGINNDGSQKVGFTAPSVEGQVVALSRAYEAAGFSPETVQYVEAHGTGTSLGDPIEIAALKRVYQGAKEPGYCAVTSSKPNIGHLDTAAGMPGLIKTALALEHKTIPPSINCERPNPKLELEGSPFFINTELRPWQANGGPRRAATSCFGMGGTNVHMVLEEAPERPPSSTSRPWQLLLLSSRTPDSLEVACDRLAEHLETDPQEPLADIAYTLQVGRKVFDRRLFAVVEDTGDALRVLKREQPERLVRGTGGAPGQSVVFLFPGQGTQYPGMGRDLYENEPVFRREVDRCAEILEPELGLDLRSLLYPAPEEMEQAAGRLRETALTQPALFTIEWALARLWQSWGFEPRAMIGHSIGEYAAACLAGVFTLEDVLAVVATRGRLMQEMEPGSMLALTLPVEEVEELIAVPAYERLSVSAVNAPRFVVVGGPSEDIDALQRQLEEEGRPGRRLHTSHAFHTAMMEPMLEPMRERLRQVEMKPPKLPIRSNLTGEWLGAEQATDPDYWVAQVRQSVRFSEGLAGLLADQESIFLEVGPGRTLVSFLQQQPGKGASTGIPSLPHAKEPGSAQAFLLGALGRAWIAGAAVDWDAFYADEERYRVPLPTYPFQRQRYWLTFQREAQAEESVLDLERREVEDWFYLPSWKRSLPPSQGSGGGRWLVFADPCGVGDRVADRLEELGAEVARVERGEGFARLSPARWTTDPRSEEDLARLLEEVAEAGGAPAGIAYFWTVTTPEDDEDWRHRDDLEVLGFHCPLALVRAWNRYLDKDPVRLRMISNDLHSITGQEEIVPLKALAIGPCRVITQEYPQIDCRNVDLALGDLQGRHADALIEHLSAELLTGEPGPRADDFIAYRSGRRWLREIEAVKVGEPARPSPRLRPEGVYLITGGLGGIGLELAEYLARSVRAKLVLTSRKPFPEPEEWAERVARNGDSEHGDLLRRLLQLEELGAEVMVVQADVADREAMASALARVRERFGPLHGVIHSAGVPAGRMIQREDAAATAAVLAPKVRGTLVIEELVDEAGDELDFFVLCSSLASLIGGVGQADYCAANAFLDAYACVRPHAVSIGWDRWTEVGMAVKAAQQQVGAQGAPSPKETEPEAVAIEHPFLQYRISDPDGKESFISILKSEDHWVAHEHKINGEELLPGTTYFDLLSKAFKELGQGATGIELAEIGLLTPIVYPPGGAVEARLVLEPRGEEEWSFEVRSALATGPAPGPEAGRAWNRHAHGRLRSLGEVPVVERSIAEIRERCDLQERSAPDGERIPDLNHGLRWQTVKRVQAGRHEALIELALMPEIVEEAGDYVCHPALLDTALSSAPNVSEGPEDLSAAKAAYLPLWYEKARILGPMPGRVFSHVVFTKQDTSMVTVDVDIMDAEGRVVFEARGYHLRALGEEGIAAVPREQLAVLGGAEKAAEKVADPAPQVQAPEASAVADALGTGLSSQQGVEVFRRILACADEPQVAVCTRDLAGTYRLASDPEALQRQTEQEHAADAGDRLERPAVSTDYEEPRDATEATVAEIWQELLGVDKIGIFDNFFELGGHSVLGIQLVARIREAFGREIPVNVIFERSTVESLAAFLRGEGEESSQGEEPAAASGNGSGSSEEAAGIAPDELQLAVEELSASEVEAMLEQMAGQEEVAS